MSCLTSRHDVHLSKEQGPGSAFASEKSRCSNLTDCIAFIYDYLIIELQLEPCGNINSLYLAAKNSNISGGGITAEGPVHTDGLLTSAVAGL
ncbi:hypothetical protein WJX79_006108 [Trebouxia sp. C0005]